MDYYLHQGQHGYQHEPAHDELIKQALAAITLHCASRPWNESSAWTIHLREPLLNLFVAGDNRLGNVVGQAVVPATNKVVAARGEMVQAEDSFRGRLAQCSVIAWPPVEWISAWTIHLREPLLNLFVAGDNRLSTVVGQLFTENVRTDAPQIFIADVVRGTEGARRSAVDFTGQDMFRAVEHYYLQSEQRLGRFFARGAEDFVFVSAQPQCDLDWLENLDHGGR